MNQAKPIEKCQICGSKSLKTVLFLGYVPPVNTMRKIGRLPSQETFFPLGLQRCFVCGLVQNITEVAPETLFPPEYPYLSGTTRILRENFADLYRESKKMLDLKPDDLIVDIGSNDGTLLSNFKNGGHRVLGIEPSRAAIVANNAGIETIMEFFNRKIVKTIKEKYDKAKIITATNVFAHIPDIHSVVEGINDLLSSDGVFISESHYLADLIATLQYDTIYHEHLRYYSLSSLVKLMKMHDLEVFYVKRIPTHGGSIRVYAARKGQKKIDSLVRDLLISEEKIINEKALEKFSQDVLHSKTDLISLLGDIKKKDAKIYGIGAPSRASTLINYTGIDEKLVNCVLEVPGSNKIGKYMPGTMIPVLEESRLYQDQPEYALLFSWHIASELIPKLKEKGYQGKFIVPLAKVKIV